MYEIKSFLVVCEIKSYFVLKTFVVKDSLAIFCLWLLWLVATPSLMYGCCSLTISFLVIVFWRCLRIRHQWLYNYLRRSSRCTSYVWWFTFDLLIYIILSCSKKLLYLKKYHLTRKNIILFVIWIILKIWHFIIKTNQYYYYEW